MSYYLADGLQSLCSYGAFCEVFLVPDGAVAVAKFDNFRKLGKFCIVDGMEQAAVAKFDNFLKVGKFGIGDGMEQVGVAKFDNFRKVGKFCFGGNGTGWSS